MEDKQAQQPSIESINKHYDRCDIEAEIRNAVDRAGLAFSQITRSDLSAFDELHIGGKSATMALAQHLKLPAGSLVLDVGSGLGGPARTLAAEFGYTVVGIDLTERFCRLSRLLTSHLSMSSSTGFFCGNALNMPFKTGCFDGIWSQHCSMNIPDKEGLYAEYHRVLKKGGTLLIHDVVAGEESPIYYPMPWAHDQSISFLTSDTEMETRLSGAGFTEIHKRDISNDALAWFEQQKTNKADRNKSVFNQKMVYGDNLLTMVRNMVRNLKETRIRIVEVILQR